MYPLTSLCDPLSFWNREKSFTLCGVEHFLLCRMNGNHLMMKLILSLVFLKKIPPRRHSLSSNWKCETESHISCSRSDSSQPLPSRSPFLVSGHTQNLRRWPDWVLHMWHPAGGREKRDVGGGLELVKVSRRSQAFRPIADQTIGCSLFVWCLLFECQCLHMCVAPQCIIRKVENLSYCERNISTQPKRAVCCCSRYNQE